MKKLLLVLIACTLVFSACKKDEEDAQQQQVETMKDFLTNKDGWQLSSVTCTHELHLQNNTTIAANTELLTGDYASGTGYFYAYEIDDIYKFVASANAPTEGTEYLNGNTQIGDINHPAQTNEDISLGTYIFNSETMLLGLYLPWAPTAFTTASIKTLNKNTMELICNYTIQGDNAKLDPGEYTFTVKFRAL